MICKYCQINYFSDRALKMHLKNWDFYEYTLVIERICRDKSREIFCYCHYCLSNTKRRHEM